MQPRLRSPAARGFGLNQSNLRGRTKPDSNSETFRSVSHNNNNNSSNNNNNNSSRSSSMNNPITHAPLTPIASFSSTDLSRLRRQSPDAYQALVQYEQLLRRMTAHLEAKDVELQRCMDVGQEVLGQLDEMQSHCAQLAAERDEITRRARREAQETHKRIISLEAELQSYAKERTRRPMFSVAREQTRHEEKQGYRVPCEDEKEKKERENERGGGEENPSPELMASATQSAAVYNQLIDILQHMESWCAHVDEAHPNDHTQNSSSNLSSIYTRRCVPVLSSAPESRSHILMKWLTGTLDEMAQLVPSLARLSQRLDAQRQRSDMSCQIAEAERVRALDEMCDAQKECEMLRNALSTLRAEVAAIDAETNRIQMHENNMLRDLESRVAERDAVVISLTQQLRNAQIESAALQDASHRAVQRSRDMTVNVQRYEELETELMCARECVQASEATIEALKGQLLQVRQCVSNAPRVRGIVEQMASAVAERLERGSAAVKSQFKQQKQEEEKEGEGEQKLQLLSTSRVSQRDSHAAPCAEVSYEKQTPEERANERYPKEEEGGEGEDEEKDEYMEYSEREMDNEDTQAAAAAVSRFVCDWASAVEQILLLPIYSALDPSPAPALINTTAAVGASATTSSNTLLLQPEHESKQWIPTTSNEETWATAAGGVVSAFTDALLAILYRMNRSYRVHSHHRIVSHPESDDESAVRCIALCARVSELEECLAMRTRTQSAEREQWRDAVTLLQTERAEARRPLRATRERLQALREAWRVQQERIDAEARETRALREVNRALERRIAEVEGEREPLRLQLQSLLLGNARSEGSTLA